MVEGTLSLMPSFTSSDENVLGAIDSYLRSNIEQEQELMIRVKLCESSIRDLQSTVQRMTASHGAFTSLQRIDSPKVSNSSSSNNNALAAEEKDDENEAEKMCDYCFKFTRCLSCPECHREWYCSSPCRRLRDHLHRSICRRRKGNYIIQGSA
ncbi:uncharacterized protein TM35_000481200 [Trypanosoma theileri]|uniref:MYND-type domain-containing protein n=1 Tax=Trypanosoma theileri TaxID=67003 RepID=A0A1X0NIZ4_9TRYP|nr:uncharacterized protein TM35_000481200 [Trypanosoma theileri]ORC84159.1 hypothetical protein TM35_000481200 [Trypanosoma theileri]